MNLLPLPNPHNCSRQGCPFPSPLAFHRIQQTIAIPSTPTNNRSFTQCLHTSPFLQNTLLMNLERKSLGSKTTKPPSLNLVPTALCDLTPLETNLFTHSIHSRPQTSARMSVSYFLEVTIKHKHKHHRHPLTPYHQTHSFSNAPASYQRCTSHTTSRPL